MVGSGYLYQHISNGALFMKIFLHEVTERESELSFTEKDEWVKAAVLSADEHLEVRPIKPSQRKIDVNLKLQKVDNVYVITGKLKTFVQLVCSRCADTFQYPCAPQFSALFCQEPVLSGVRKNRGFARHAHDEDSDESKDIDITYLSQEFIDLTDVITEQLQLQIPFQPLCRSDCKGICAQCGSDFNVGRCACAKFAPSLFGIQGI